MKWILLVATGLSSCLTPIIAHPDSIDRGAILSASCEGCHGVKGVSPGAIPSLAGKPAEYIRVVLEQYKSGDRAGTVMGRHARGYTEEEIAAIAAYFGGES